MGRRDSGLSDFMRHSVHQRVRNSLLILGLISSALTGCIRYRFDLPAAMLQAPDSQIWGVSFEGSGSDYRIRSLTRLNGSHGNHSDPNALIASGNVENWQWEVRAVPSLLPSWKAWESDSKVQQRAVEPDSWDHPAATWQQAFSRAYKVVTYLLGRQPVPLKLTVLLVPDGSGYEKTIVQNGNGVIPLTFAFHYPPPDSDSTTFTAARFSALVEAVSRSIYEYQHILVATNVIQPVGNNETDKTINDETRSHCWFDSTFLALTAGTHTETTWTPAPAALLEESTHHTTSLETQKGTGAAQDSDVAPNRRYSDAVLWARYLESKSVFSYLQQAGINNGKVTSNEYRGMNAMLSVCRAMTQHPLDLTSGSYPPKQVEYAPFFPANKDADAAKRNN
jgi:hypothetical protein